MPLAVELRGCRHDLLHRVVAEGLAALRAALAEAEADRSIARHVERELEKFVTCGDPKLGFAWLECTWCDHQRLVP